MFFFLILAPDVGIYVLIWDVGYRGLHIFIWGMSVRPQVCLANINGHHNIPWRVNLNTVLFDDDINYIYRGCL